MFRCALCLLLLFGLSGIGPAAGRDEAVSLGPGAGSPRPNPDDPPCDGALLLHYDGTAENGYAWRSGGVVPPDYGSFAEGYWGIGAVCGQQLHLSTLDGYFHDQTLDAFVYGNDQGNPGTVLSVTVDIHLDPPAIWPEVSVHDIALPLTAVDGPFFVGSWGNWPGMLNAWFWIADEDGPGGLPRTKIAPGIGYPSGWQDVSVVWGPTQAMGIGAYLTEEPPPNPTRPTRWGRIKSLF